MPEEVVGIIIIALTFFTALSIVLMINVRKYLENKNGLRQGSGPSLTTSELEAMVEKAAIGAMKPLVKRIENLEAVVTDTEGPGLLTEAQTFLDPPELDSNIKVTRRQKS